MKEFIEFIAKNLVDNPAGVKVEEVQQEDNTIKIILQVDDLETGKVIGKSGKTAKAMRILLTAVAAKNGKRAYMEIADKLNRKN